MGSCKSKVNKKKPKTKAAVNIRDIDPIGQPAPRYAAACACHGGGHGGSDHHDTGGSAACGGRDGD